MATTFEDVIIRVTQRGADEAAKSIGLIGKESEKTAGALASLNRIMYTIAGAISVKSLTDTVSAYQSMTNQLKLVTKGAEDLAKTQERLFKMAQTNRTAVEDLTDLYSKLALSQKEIGISGERIYKVTDLISKALANNGKGSQAAAAGLKQLIQGLQSGRLAGEELKSVLENTPYLANKLAQGLGVPLGKLREMGAAGELTADRVVKAFEKMGTSIEADFKKMDVTIAQALVVLDNAWKRFIGGTGEATGASKAFSAAIVLLANNIGTVVTAIAAATAAWIAYRIAVVAVTAAQAAANLMINANPIVRLVTIIGSAIALFIALTGNLESTTKWMMSLGTAALETFKSIGKGVTDTIQWFTDLGTSVTTTATTLSTSFNQGIQSIWDFIKSWYDWLVDLIGTQVPETFKTAVDKVYTFFENGFTKVKNFVLGIFDSIKEALSSFVSWASNVINNVVAAAQRALAVVKSIGGGSAASSVDGQRASGGPVSGGKTYLVGEEGPELFVPGTSGTIIPNGGSGNAMTSGTAATTRQVNPVQMLQRVLQETLGTQLVALHDLGVKHSDQLGQLIELTDKIANATTATNSTVQDSAAAASASGSGFATSAINNYVQNGMTSTAGTSGSPIAPAGGMGGTGGGFSGESNDYGSIQRLAKELADRIARYQKNLAGDPRMEFSRTRNSYTAYRQFLDTVPQGIRSEVENLAGSYLPVTINGIVARSGAQFTVPGHTGVDSKVIPIRATPGEEVTVRTPKQQRDAEAGGAGHVISEINFYIQTPDANSFRQSQTQIMRDFSRDLSKALRKG